MVAHTISDSTMYRFNRSEKRWEEKSTGNVTFSLNNYEARLSTGKASYLIQGEIKPKNNNSIVMGVMKENAPREPHLIILAVRFSNEGDIQRLFSLLGSDRKSVDRSSVAADQTTNLPSAPPWLLAMGRREQLNVRALALNTSLEYINNRVVLNKVAADYNLTPEQLAEAITYFHQTFSHPRRTWPYPRMNLSPSFSNGGQPISPHMLNAARNPLRRFDPKSSHSISRNSWHSHSEIDRNAFYPKLNEHSARRKRLYGQMTELQKKLQNVHSNPAGGIPCVHGRSSSRLMHTDSRSARSPSLSVSVHQIQHVPLGLDHHQHMSHRSSGFLELSGTLPLNAGHYRYPTAETLVKASAQQPEVKVRASGFSTPEDNERKCVTVPHTPQADLPTIPEKKQTRRRSARKVSKSNHKLPHEEKVEKVRVTSPLTKKNLALYNEQVPPLKGNCRKIVRSWFRKYFSPNADSNGLISEG